MKYRRALLGGATYFFTVNLADRGSRVLTEHIDDLRDAVRAVRLVAFGDVQANDWLVVNQFPAIEGQHYRRRLVMWAIQHVTQGA